MPAREEGSGYDEQYPDIEDLTQLQADDALLDALGTPGSHAEDDLSGDELDAVLRSWRREVDSEPVPELVDAETAAMAIRSARRASTRHARKWKGVVPVTVAACVLGIAFAGTGIAARDAQPGDTLWGVTTVLYSDKARSIEAASEVRHEFDLARTALSQGQVDQARSALDEANVALDSVNVEEDRAQLEDQHRELVSQLDDGDADSSDPPEQDEQSGQDTEPADSSQPTSTEEADEDGGAQPTETTPTPTTSPEPEPTETSTPTPSPSTETGTGTSARQDETGTRTTTEETTSEDQ